MLSLSIPLVVGAAGGALAAVADWLSRPPCADRAKVAAFVASRGRR